MKNQITMRDIELLSAYLDNQLSSRERNQLEYRLKADPALRRELQEINQTRSVIRQLPRRRAPRNYYLKPEAVRQRATVKLAPIFGMISAVASVLLGVVLIGSRFAVPTSQVAFAPAPSVAQQTVTVQQETSRNLEPTIPPTEAAPAAKMSAPALAPSSTPFTAPSEASPTGIATPTTIYLFAYPPTSTPESGLSIAGIEVETPTMTCEDYYGTEPLPNLPDVYQCATPTSTSSQFLESINPGALITMTSTETATATYTSTPTETETPSPTASATATDTPSPTETPFPSETTQPPIPENPSSASKLAPSEAVGENVTTNPTYQATGLGSQTNATQQPAETASTAQNSPFFSYILLSVEISLAAIALLAGITALILRFRTH
jgi:hypothetical protein